MNSMCRGVEESFSMTRDESRRQVGDEDAFWGFVVRAGETWVSLPTLWLLFGGPQD